MGTRVLTVEPEHSEAPDPEPHSIEGSSSGRVAVIGAGLIGAAIAHRLATRGVDVVVFGEGRVGGDASSASFAWVNANGKQPASYRALNRAGMAEHRQLVAELGHGSWLHHGGNIEYATSPDVIARIEARVSETQSDGQPAQWLSPTELAGLEPDLVGPADDGARVAWFPDEPWIDVVPLAGILLAEAVRHGATLRLDTPVATLEMDGDRVVALTTAGGERVTARTFVNCAGPDGSKIAALAGLTIPLRASDGLLVITSPSGVRTERIVHMPGVYWRPDGGGRLMLASDAADRVLREEGRGRAPQLADDLLGRAIEYLPRLAGATVEAVRIGRRALPADGYPIVGPMAKVPNLYHVITHSGITLGPLLGKLVAREIADGADDPLLQPYRPDRLDATA